MRTQGNTGLTFRMPANAAAKARPPALFAAGVMALAIAASSAAAAGRVDAEARARYEKERAACLGGESRQDRATCLQEAGAALRASQEGALSAPAAAERIRNTMNRCEFLPTEDRDACVRRMRGEGMVKGSVADGGIYRELTVPDDSQPANLSPTGKAAAFGK